MNFIYSIFLSLAVAFGVVPERKTQIIIHTPQDCVENRINDYAIENGVLPETKQIPAFREVCWGEYGAQILDS